MRDRRKGTRQAGFSLFELMTVMLIIMVVSAIAIPTMMNTLADVRLRSSASTIQGQLQQLRMRAVRDNKPYKGKMTTQAGVIMMYLDLDGDSAYDANEPSVALARDVRVAFSGTSAPTMPDTLLPGISAYATGNMSTAIWFNARGLPCDTSASAACNTSKGYIYYLGQLRSSSRIAWAAVSVTPAGRVKVWRWTGSAWL